MKKQIWLEKLPIVFIFLAWCRKHVLTCYNLIEIEIHFKFHILDAPAKLWINWQCLGIIRVNLAGLDILKAQDEKNKIKALLFSNSPKL